MDLTLPLTAYSACLSLADAPSAADPVISERVQESVETTGMPFDNKLTAML